MNYFVIPGVINSVKLTLQQRPIAIIRLLADHFHVHVSNILVNNSRKEPLLTARHLSIYFIFQHCHITKSAIAEMFGIHHATIIHAINKISGLNKVDDSYKNLLKNLDDMITSSIYKQTID